MFKRYSKLWYFYIAICVFVIGQYMYNSKIDEYKNSIKAKSVVTDILLGRGRKGVVYEYPQFSFVYNDSSYFGADKFARHRNYSIGDSTNIIFTRDNPSEAIVYDFLRYWIPLPVLLFGILLSLIFPAIAFVFNQYSEFKKEQQTHKL